MLGALEVVRTAYCTL